MTTPATVTGVKYADDRTVSHREYWQAVWAAVRAEAQEPDCPDESSLTLSPVPNLI
jgi:hypothetical protein